MTNTVEQYKETMALAAKQAQGAKENYLQIIVDKSVPLEERWNIFVNAPHEFKEHDHYIVDFDVIEEKLPNFTLYDDLHADRYETVETADMVETFIEKMEDYERNKNDEDTGKILYENPNIIDELKEEILIQNCGSFKNDW